MVDTKRNASTINNNASQICTNPTRAANFVSRNLNETVWINDWTINGLMLSNAVLMTLVVCVGAYGPGYRRHPLLAFLVLAATTLFLPILSNVASKIGAQNTAVIDRTIGTEHILVWCTSLHFALALVWTGLVLAIGVTTSPVVASDSREGRTIAPPSEQLVKTIWTGYLTLPVLFYASDQFGAFSLFLQLFFIIFTKLLFKYSAFYMARRSAALGRSPRLIAGYMAQLQEPVGDRGQNTGAPPALIIMGEDTVKRKEQPHGYSFRGIPDPHRLVTLDRVWQVDDKLLGPRAKDLCFSFALFKLLRCRFAKYTIFESGIMKAQRFLVQTLLQGDDYHRVFRVFADELSFIHHYYYSSLAVSYSGLVLLAVSSAALSLYTIGYCLYVVIFISGLLTKGDYHKILCRVTCMRSTDGGFKFQTTQSVKISNTINPHYIDVIPAYLVLAALMLAEMRNIAFYICSNWTKVALIFKYVKHPSWHRSPVMRRCIAFLLTHCRCRLAGDNWGDRVNRMGQCSVLFLHHPSKIPLLGWFCGWKKMTNIPDAAKATIFEALKREDLLIVTTRLEGTFKAIRPPSSPLDSVVCCDPSQPAGDGKRIAHTILVWHIATSVFEIMRQPPTRPSDHEHCHAIAATHLSRYCAYLVTYCPELLPSDDEWCKKLYADVKKDADRVLARARRQRKADDGGLQVQRQLLLERLREDSEHEVLKNGVRLGMELLDSGTEWEALARSWSEMILYVAPSENLEGHANTIARAGELISVLWFLLAHAGVPGRVEVDAMADAPTHQGTTKNDLV